MTENVLNTEAMSQRVFLTMSQMFFSLKQSRGSKSFSDKVKCLDFQFRTIPVTVKEIVDWKASNLEA